MGRINYYLNGIDMRGFGVHVSAGKGLISMPDRKAGISRSYDDEHGISVDVSAGYVKERKITLNCFTDKMTITDYVSSMNAFKHWLLSAGMFQLMVELGGDKPLIYLVYWDGRLDITSHYDASSGVGTFDMTLIEPSPVKKVARVVTGSADQILSIELMGPGDKSYDVYWGDGTNVCLASGGDASHEYSCAGTYYLVVAGDVDAIELVLEGDTDLDPVEIWSGLL